MSTSTARTAHTRDQGSLGRRVRTALGTRGEHSNPVRPHADVHRIFRLQPPPFV